MAIATFLFILGLGYIVQCSALAFAVPISKLPDLAARTIDKDTTWTVCHSGCDYRGPLEAFNLAMTANFRDGAKLTIALSDGVYDVPDQLLTSTPQGGFVRIIGNTVNRSRVILNFNNKSNGIGGFTAMDGGSIGFIDGVTINGVGGIKTQDQTHTDWHDNSWGAGIFATRGGRINVGAHVRVVGFYYSALADEGGSIFADGMEGDNAGDVNFLARHNGILRCIGCVAQRAADNAGHKGKEDGDPVELGCNFMAESGGALIITQARASHSHIAAICALTNGKIWADMVKADGGLSGPTGSGLWAISGGTIQANHSTIFGYRNGILAGAGGKIYANNALITKNTVSGITADGGQFVGSDDTVTNNRDMGLNVFHHGDLQLYGSFKKLKDNGIPFKVEPPGLSNGAAYAGSSLILD